VSALQAIVTFGLGVFLLICIYAVACEIFKGDW